MPALFVLAVEFLAVLAPVGVEVGWEFDQPGLAGGWDQVWVHDLALPFQVSDGVLRTIITGDDPYMTSPSIDLPGEQIPMAAVRMRGEPETGLKGAFYWTTHDDPVWGEDKRIAFDAVGDGEWHLYTVYLSLHGGWRGTIARFRFDPPAAGVPGNLEIDYIRLGDWPEEVAIDFSRTHGPALPRASGYLTDPPGAVTRPLLAKLRPVMIRHQFNSGYLYPVHYQAVNSLGAKIQLIPGVSWWWLHPHEQQPPPGSFPGDNGEWGPWESFLESLLSQAAAQNQSYDWDIWNEPDHTGSWNPAGLDSTASRTRFFEAWRRAWLKIRELAPGDRIIGPSTSRFEGGLFSVEGFLAYAHAEGVLPDVVSWHSSNAGQIAGQCERIRAFMGAAGIDERPISINEIVAEFEQTRPGALVGYYAAVERGGVESAAHSCWADPDAASPLFANCGNDSISGLLKESGSQRLPRSTYWAAWTYAQRTGLSVEVRPGSTIDGVAGYDPEESAAVILLGRSDLGGGDVLLRLLGLIAAEGLVAGEQVRVRAARIAHSGWDAAESPPLVIDDLLAVGADGSSSLLLPAFGPADAYAIWLSRLRYRGDIDGDLDVDQEDFGLFQACLGGPGVSRPEPECRAARLDEDDDVDQGDLTLFRACLSGAGQTPDAACVQ